MKKKKDREIRSPLGNLNLGKEVINDKIRQRREFLAPPLAGQNQDIPACGRQAKLVRLYTDFGRISELSSDMNKLGEILLLNSKEIFYVYY